MPEPEELELILMPDGTTIVNVCAACLLGTKDDRCKAPQVDFLKEMIAEGHITGISEPTEVPA